MSASPHPLHVRVRNRLNGERVGRQVRGGQALWAEPGVRIDRRARGTTVEFGRNVHLSRDVQLHLFQPGATIRIGDEVFVNWRTEILACDRVELGPDCLLGWDVCITDSDFHGIVGRDATSPIVIGEHVWIGSRALILKGVTVGDGAVIAAGSVVHRDVPAGALVGGNPARVLRPRIEWRRDPDGAASGGSHSHNPA